MNNVYIVGLYDRYAMTKKGVFMKNTKSVAAALLFAVILGPVGLLYSSFWGGVIMIPLTVIVVCSKFAFPFVIAWLISCIWAVG